MHLYTSSSDGYIPEKPWLKLVVIALILSATILSVGEIHLRSLGFTPTIDDDVDFWCYHRAKLHAHDHHAVVLLGASRIGLGIDTEVFRGMMDGHSPIQLALDGHGDSRAILEQLSLDPSFCGTVIVDFYPMLLVDKREYSDLNVDEYLHAFKQWSWSKSVNRHVKMVLESRLNVMSTEYMRQLIKYLISRKKPKPPYLVQFPDRRKEADYTLTNLDQQKKYWSERFANSLGELKKQLQDLNKIKTQMEKLEQMVLRIQQRGGRVVFLRMPSSGHVKELEDKYTPRRSTWDLLEARTKATMINFEDYPSLSSYKCAEDSHLDFRDARRFTIALVRILKEKVCF